MKIHGIVIFIVFITSACSTQIQSVVDHSVAANVYAKPLMIIRYESWTKNFAQMLKKRIDERFKEDKNKIEIQLTEERQEELTLNASNNISPLLLSTNSNGQNDLILIVIPTHLNVYNGILRGASYLITGIDTRTTKEVWKAEFSSSSVWGPSIQAQKTASKIYEKLKQDEII